MKSIDELRAEVEARQRAFDRALEQVRVLGEERTRLHYYVKTYPWALVAAGFAMGLWVGLAGGRRWSAGRKRP